MRQNFLVTTEIPTLRTAYPPVQIEKKGAIKNSETVSRELSRGTLVCGRYEIEALTARGGFATLYRAWDVVDEQRVALKIPHKKTDNCAAARKDLFREASIVSDVTHKGVVQALDFGLMSDHSPFLVMSWCEGETLVEILKRGALPLKDSLAVLAQLMEALRAIHQAGYFHGDLTPSNVMVQGVESGQIQVCLIDFGLATQAQAVPRQEEGNNLIGTPAYMAPEKILGKVPDCRADIYATGAIFYRCLTGCNLFRRSSVVETLRAHLVAPLEPLPVALCPEQERTVLQCFMEKLLARNREDRIQNAETARAFVTAMLATLSGTGSHTYALAS